MQLGIWPESILILQSKHSPATYPIFSPHSPYARSISDLSSGVLWAMLGIFIVVTALVTYCIHKFRATPNQAFFPLTSFMISGCLRWDARWT